TAEMRGVEVKAHPFADMLTALDPGEPPATLADYAPADRLFVWVTDPRRLSQWLAPEVAGRFAPLLGGGFVDYGLLERYTGRFGMTLKEARTVLASGFISELALVAPDVFFRDNTDVTLVLRLNPAAMSFQFNRNVTLPVARRGDLLVLSTLQSELDAVLALIDAKGAESLGRSDEFRVMAAKLPVRDETKMFVYFSDPFIRRLTGPEVKIGQLRRATARARLEKFAARALLFRLDHGRDAEDTAELVRRHYAEEDEFPPDEFSLSPGCRAVSKTWGPLASLATLTAIPALTATPTEAAQYAAYRDRYTEFWRQYFDPVAVRLDATPQGGIALETFILPLIENSLYDGLKSVLGATPAEPLMVPEYDQPAIATLTFRIPGLPENLQSQMYGPARLFSPLLELAGTTVALSIRDTAPIVQVNFPGVSSFAGDSGFSDFLDPGMLVAAPFVASLFTRPCDIAIRVTDEARARAFLQGMRGFKSEFFEIETFYINDRETLILTWVLGGILRVELGLSVKDGWLHISNHPWTPANITGTRVENNAHAFIALTPSNLRAGLPQANALLRNKARESAADAAFSLKPWREAFHADAAAASGFQRAALGFATPVPSGVEDPPRGNRVETFDADAPLPAAIPDLRLHLGFEDDGLRSRVEFLPRNAAK
ncbi:MAG: hypothetical protein FWF96_02900, partial [Kiritimatiellaeota bacterium]|nr:hypothetical protein [Kiritimatiellota bacterium]